MIYFSVRLPPDPHGEGAARASAEPGEGRAPPTERRDTAGVQRRARKARWWPVWRLAGGGGRSEPGITPGVGRMEVIVCMVAAFYFGTGHPPRAASQIVDSPEACAALGAASVATLEKDPKVSGASFRCAVAFIPVGTKT